MCVLYVLFNIEKCKLQWPKQLNAPLEVVDPEIADIIEHEKARQWKVLSLFSCILLPIMVYNMVLISCIRIRNGS